MQLCMPGPAQIYPAGLHDLMQAETKLEDMPIDYCHDEADCLESETSFTAKLNYVLVDILMSSIIEGVRCRQLLEAVSASPQYLDSIHCLCLLDRIGASTLA